MGNKTKTHSWVSKRFKITKNKKVVAKKSCNNHLLTNKWKNNKKSPYGKEMSKSFTKKVRDLVN